MKNLLNNKITMKKKELTMKNLLKLSATALLSLSLFACPMMNEPELSPVGSWENSIKNNDGSTVVTTLDVTETKIKKPQYDGQKGFSAKMQSKIEGKESDTLKLTNSEINVSGTMYESNLTITDVDSATDSINTSSRLTLSKDGKYLTLQPGDIKFKRKNSK
ncbi:MAG: hypothetical protein U0457_06025 [Candidatus Sericytochromatia bacterium]